MKFKRSSPASGITLLEVVASIALLGTLLTLVLVANAKNLRQIKAAQRKRESVERLDLFLATWSVHHFAADGVPAAVERSGMPARGDLGQHGPTNSASPASDFHVEIKRRAAEDPELGMLVRLTVRMTTGAGEQVSTAWAEVMVRP